MPTPETLPLGRVLLSLWTENSDIGRVLIMVISVLVGVAVSCTVRHARRYRIQEDRSLGWAENNLQTWRAEVDPGPVSEEALDRTEEEPVEEVEQGGLAAQMPLENISRLLENTGAGSLARRRIEAIDRMRRLHLKVSAEALQQLSHNSEESRLGLKLPAFVAGISMMLGMLGTFIGLSAVVSDINLQLPNASVDVSVDTWQQSIQNIRLVLGGMKTAFSTTLVGIFGALVCSLCDFRLRHEQAVFFEKFEGFTANELIAATLPSLEDETLIQRVSRQLESSFSDVQDLFEENRKTVKELTGAEKGFLGVVKEIQTATHQNSNSNLTRVATELTQTNSGLVEVVGQMPKLVEIFEKKQSDLGIVLDNLTRSVESMEHAAKRQIRISPIVAFGLFFLGTLALLVFGC